MTTHIWYSTFATALITTIWGNVYQRDFECHELEWLRTWAQEALEEDGCEMPSRAIVSITFIDSETGELLLECKKGEAGPTAVDDWDDDDEPYDDDWGYNEDMGYDPYLGCYTDDC
jgi:hypothetical protein